MQVTVAQIAALVNGTVEGDPETVITQPSRIEEAEPGSICFLANPKYEAYAYDTEASALLVRTDFRPEKRVKSVLIRVEDVYASLAVLLDYYEKMQAGAAEGVSERAYVASDAVVDDSATVGHFAVVEAGASVGADCVIHAQVYIGPNVKVGAGTIIYPGARIYRDCQIGKNCILHSNVVIGSDGFGFAPREDGTYDKIAQIGNVVLEDEVEVGANTVVDRATMGSTRIRAGAKLDNLIQIAHNVEVGENTVIAAQAGIAGSTRVGKGVMIGGQAGFVGHIEIADGVKVQAQSGINSSITEPGKAVYGSPALAYTDFLRAYAVFRKLPDMNRRLRELEKRLRQFESDNE